MMLIKIFYKMKPKIHPLIFICISYIIGVQCIIQRSEMLNSMINTPWLYTEEGNLTIMQHNELGHFSKEVKLFFKGRLSKCDSELKKNAIYFDIIVCIPKDSDCPKGLKICYESNLKSDHLKEKNKHLMENKNNAHQCLDKKYDHSLYINISRRDKMAYAYIVSSIDELVYKVDLPQINKDEINIDDKIQCFKIRVGTENSIQTQITDIFDNKLTVTPSLEEEIDVDVMKLVEKGWKDRKEKNFNLFSLDFIPKLNKWRQNYGDYYKTFRYQGSKEICNMSLQFVGEKVHRCSLEWIETGLKCQGPFFSEQLQNQGHSNECKLDPNDSKRTIVKGNEKINTCKFEITYQTGDTITNIIRDTSSSGYVNEQEKYNKLVLRPYKDYSVLRDTAYDKRIYNKENINLTAHGTIVSGTNIYKVETTWELFVTAGCEIVSQELFLNCNGYTVKTGQFRFEAREIESKLPPI